MSREQHPGDRIVCAALIAAGVLLCTNCGGGDHVVEGTGTTDEADTGEAPTGEPSEPGELPGPSCAGDVFVGRLTKGGTCGNFDGVQGAWVGTSLGSEGILASFCEYRWTSVGDADPDPAALPGPMDDVGSLAELCPRVLPQAGYFTGDGQLRGLTAAEFMANVGKPSSPMPADRAPVDVRLIDTVPNGLLEKGLTPRSYHGLILRKLAVDMLCTAGDCRATVGNHLGLPRLNEHEVDTERGGFFGNLVELASGINEALAQSEADDPNAQRVLVLALGWDGIEDYGSVGIAGKTVSDIILDPAVPADLQLVISSLARASCRGALAVAAAGNSTTEPCTQTGPTGPGFLEALSAPDAAMCDVLGFDHSGVELGEEHSLVLAATHVTPDGESPANARQGAQAALVAQGAAFGDPDATDEMLRGSSVAATVIGATAAWVWSYYPKLTPAQIRQVIYTSGTTLPGEPVADFPRPTESRQVSICSALFTACELSGGDCAGFPVCTHVPGADPAIAAHLQNKLEDPCLGEPGCTMPHTLALGPDFPSNGQTPSACGGEIMVWPESNLPPLAPLPPLPWTNPQPGKSMCPTCFVGINADKMKPGIKVGLDFVKDVELPEQLFVHVETSTGSYRIAIPVEQLVSDHANIVEIFPPIDWGEIRGVVLGYVFAGLDGALQYRSEPLVSLRYPCEGGGPDACTAKKVFQVGTGAYHTCALLSGGKVKCWGGNLLGQLGLGDTNARGDSPEEMGENLPSVDLGTNLSAVQIAVGGFHTCALLSSGAVKCWGVNGEGVLGGSGVGSVGNEPGEMGDALSEVDLGVHAPVMELTASEAGTCALFQNGALKCWGRNLEGQLGLGDTESRGVYASEMGDALPFVDLGEGQTATAVSSGNWHTCMQSPGGLVKCWGEASFLGLGLSLGSVGDQIGEMGDALPFLNLGNNVKAKIVRAGDWHSCAVLETGLLKCWGQNMYGQLGVAGESGLGDEPGEMGEALKAVDLGVKSPVVDIAVSDKSVCALLKGGLVKCWGWNDDGQLGLGDTESRGYGAEEMGEMLPFVDTGAAVKALQRSTSFSHYCVVLVDASVKCWGRNLEGQLGLGDTENRGDEPDEMGNALPRVKLFSSEW